MSSGPRVVVIAYTKFLGVPAELGEPAPSQDQGSHGARLIECAGRTCYDSFGRGRDSAAYVRHILESGNTSVLEHASISFYISGISRGCLGELTRHRVGVAFSVRSTRYCDESESEWCWHPLFEKLVSETGTPSALVQCREAASVLYRVLYGALTERLVWAGVEPAVARKQSRGAARGVLGNALATALVFTCNIRALRHIIALRASEHADGEIRLLANQLFQAARDVVPEYFADAVCADCADGIGYSVVWGDER